VINYSRDLTAGGWRGWFIVKTNAGVLRTGLVAGDFTATVVNPQDTSTLTPTVSESAQKPGLYSFLITDAFLATHGLGSYGTVVEVSASAPNLTDVVGSVFGYFEGTVVRRGNSWYRGQADVENEDEVVYYAEDGTTALFRNQSAAESRTPLAP
jgi:hypothetical protein